MNGPTPFSSYCVIGVAHLAQPCAQAPAISASPGYGRARAHCRFTISQPANENRGFAEKGTECDSSKDTLGSHGIPLRT